MDKNTFLKVKSYLSDQGIADIDGETSLMDLRASGVVFTIEDHIKGMIYSLLSAQTVWDNIEKHKPQIDDLFFHYDPAIILEHDYTYFVDGLAKIRCRSRLTNKQMKVLHDNIRTMQRIEEEHGSIDSFVTSMDQLTLVNMLSFSGSKYKLKQMGDALVWEYLRNIGVDGAKPDVHMKRILGSNRLGVSRLPEATNDEVIATIQKLSEETGFWMAQIDYLFWCYCATGKGEICTANPNCHSCVISDECNKRI